MTSQNIYLSSWYTLYIGLQKREGPRLMGGTNWSFK